MRTRVLGTLVVVVALAVLGACGDDDDDDATTNDTTEETTAEGGGVEEIELTAELTGGAAEVPMPGDPDGSGSATITLDESTGEVCYDITVENISEPSAAHIHEGAAGTAGGIVVTFDPGKIGEGESCLASQPTDVVAAIVANPAGYYVNVHTADFPGGAVRGQLAAA
jgi:hypothetical protein